MSGLRVVAAVGGGAGRRAGSVVGAREEAFALDHGADPVRELARRGLAGRLTGARRDDDGAIVLLYDTHAVAPDLTADPVVHADRGLVREDGEVAQPYQRAAAYGVVTSSRGVLLTELSSRTNAAGRWALPGGGIDPGEEPLAALHREVFEESGQVVAEPEIIEVLTNHWVGRAPSGRLEDFHAVRVVYRATCPEPTDPVVHDVGGSTSAAAWVDPSRLGEVRLGSSFAPHLGRWLEMS